MTQGYMGWYNFYEGNFDKAVTYIKIWHEMEPDSVLAAWYYGLFLGWNNDYQ
jgi:hypothetical protein